MLLYFINTKQLFASCRHIVCLTGDAKAPMSTIAGCQTQISNFKANLQTLCNNFKLIRLRVIFCIIYLLMRVDTLQNLQGRIAPSPFLNHQMYDAALLTRCYTQHALRPFIDSESNHIRSFIKIPFINKGIDFIDLPSIFQDKSVIQSIPTYFQNSEPPIICYKYNKPIRNTIFNFKKLVSDLDIHANTPKS